MSTTTNSNETEQLLTIYDVAEVLKFRAATIYAWINRGKLPYVQTPGGYRIKKSTIDQMLQERSKPG